MLTRRRAINHPLGCTIDLPRLVPAFSSKGFPFIVDDETGRDLSTVADALDMTGATISDSVLVSAYDISHKYLRRPERYYGNKELVIIDSGGYELSKEFDSTEPMHREHETDQSYDLRRYKEVLMGLPTNCPIAITNFDQGSRAKEIVEQIRDAQQLFNKFPKFLHDFIIKPTGRQRYLVIDDVVRHLDKMRRFHIIGVTEKELGSKLLERLINIANLRISMNRKSIDAPIHIWGGLDPVLSPLYFLAGAEIFDGVSWLRYGYLNDTAIPRDSYTAIDLGIQTQWRRAEGMRLAKNISYLETLTIRMRRFVDEGGKNFKVFETHAGIFERAYKTLCTEVPELKGGA